MKLSEKIPEEIHRQSWLRLGGVLVLAAALASVQARAQQPATPLATAGESLMRRISPGSSSHCPVPLEQAAESRGQAQVWGHLTPGLTQ